MATKTKKHNLRSNSPNNFEMELISQVKELENLKLAYDEVNFFFFSNIFIKAIISFFFNILAKNDCGENSKFLE
jgi:hypothetical protein